MGIFLSPFPFPFAFPPYAPCPFPLPPTGAWGKIGGLGEKKIGGLGACKKWAPYGVNYGGKSRGKTLRVFPPFSPVFLLLSFQWAPPFSPCPFPPVGPPTSPLWGPAFSSVGGNTLFPQAPCPFPQAPCRGQGERAGGKCTGRR